MTTNTPRPPALSYVYDGRICLGHILARGPAGFEAFDHNDRSLGLHRTMTAAADAISAEAKAKRR